MRISMKRPEWDPCHESSVYRVAKGQRVLGRVDFIASLGYWWQTADDTGVCYRLQDAKLKVEGALQPAGGDIVALASRAHAVHVALEEA